MLPAETVLADRYKLGDKLGEGSAAVVYCAEDLRLARPVAVKVLRPAYLADSEQAARFEHEARAAAGLAAPNVVTVYDYGHDAGTAFLVMQYVDGQDLKQYVRQQGRLAPEAAARIALAVCRGLAAAHERGIIHRDVKPQNILLDRHGVVRLTDFGIAKALGGPGLTQAGMTYGTAAYLSPEQATGQPVGPPADLYALGLVLYEMLCGQPPFHADDPAALAYKQVYEAPPRLQACVPDVPPALAVIVERALQKDPAARYPSADAMAADLEAFLRTAPAVPVAPSPSPAPPAGYQPTGVMAAPALPVTGWPAVTVPPARRRAPGWIWLLVPLLALLLAGGWFASQYVHFNSADLTPTPLAGSNPPPSASPAPTQAPATAVAGGAPASATPAPAPATEPPAATAPPAPTEPPAPTAAPPAPTEPPAATPIPPTPAGSKGNPIFDTPTPPTGANRRVFLEDVAFSGGYRYPPPSIYEGRTAVWVYGHGTSFAAMSAPFQLAAQPAGMAHLTLTGLDSEDKAKTPLRLLINGQSIFNGPDPLPNDYSPQAGSWGSASWTFPATLLHPGDNTLTVENLAPSANLGIPFIMVDSAELTWDSEQ